jgi:hypothetical protein
MKAILPPTAAVTAAARTILVRRRRPGSPRACRDLVRIFVSILFSVRVDSARRIELPGIVSQLGKKELGMVIPDVAGGGLNRFL